MESKRVSVLGCGWLGLPLAQELIRLGYEVNGSTTTPDKMPVLEASGIRPFLVSFPENTPKTLSPLLDADVLIFNLPPSKTSTEKGTYEAIIQQIIEAAPIRLQKILFISSTSVYPDLNRNVVETDASATEDSNNLMLRSEYLFQQMPGAAVTVLRFGGLMGGTRHPGRWLAGKKDMTQPEAPVNMIHLQDCVAFITQILEQEKWGYTFNACAPEHPTRQEFYTHAAKLLELTPPEFISSSEVPSFKRINSELLQQELSYTFRFPDPLLCLSNPEF